MGSVRLDWGRVRLAAMAPVDSDLMDRVDGVLREHALAAVPDPADALSSLSLVDLLTEYGTWMGRVLRAVPRRAHVSRELTTNPRAAKLRRELDALVAKIESGDDLASYLSDRVWKGRDDRQVERSLSGRDDRDLLLAEWGIHHLHLTPNHGPDLLFVAFTDDSAYLIDLYGHRDWARRSVLETVIRNWPDAGILIKTGAIGLTSDWTDRDRKQLRENGISSPMIEFEGAVWAASSLGLTLDGTPGVVAHSVMGLMWTLNDWREHLDERLAQAAHAVNTALRRAACGDWAPTIYEGSIGIAREGCFYPIATLP